jgi:hypothetical protein
MSFLNLLSFICLKVIYSIDCVYLFLEKISDKKALHSSNMYDNCTLLHNAAADNDLKLCKRLVEDGLDVNCLMKTYAVNSFRIYYI